jgi:hypothetical protein
MTPNQNDELSKKIRYWDHLVSKWLMRHFYFFFFHIVLFLIFITLIFNIVQMMGLNSSDNPDGSLHRLLLVQNYNIVLLVFLMILNGFWVLNMFQTLIRMTGLLKDMGYHISRLD